MDAKSAKAWGLTESSLTTSFETLSGNLDLSKSKEGISDFLISVLGKSASVISPPFSKPTLPPSLKPPCNWSWISEIEEAYPAINLSNSAIFFTNSSYLFLSAIGSNFF